MKQFKRNNSKISYAFLFSVSLHVVLATLIYRETGQTSADLTRANIGPHQMAKNSIKLDSLKVISRKQLKAIKEAALSRQIVANENNGRNERPANSRFAGEKDQTFDRQTIARTNGSFKEAGLGAKTGLAEAKSLEPSAAPVPAKKQPMPSNKPVLKKPLSLSDLGGYELAQVAKEHEAQKEAEASAMKELEAKANSQALGIEKGAAGKTGLAQNNDFVEDVPLGDMTNLNTTEFKYYGFYHRIRQQLEQHWGSSIKDKAKNLYRSGRRMPASENLITAVTVILNDKGNIVDIKIEGTSGVRELDQAAIESFNKAGPFPNPPKGLLVGGRATIQWGFVVKS